MDPSEDWALPPELLPPPLPVPFPTAGQVWLTPRRA